MAAVIPFVMVGMSLLSAKGQMDQGAVAAQAAGVEASQMEAQAGQARATSQRAAIEERREARLAQSRLTALSAASGAGATDPTIVSLAQGIAEQGEYNALSRLFEGESQARSLETGASLTRGGGAAQKKAANIGATTTLAQGGMSLYDRYGSDLFTTEAAVA